MTLQEMLEQRRAELISFFEWRFGTRYWTYPLSYCTGLPIWISRKLRRFPIEPQTPSGLPVSQKVLSLRDIFRAETAALHLGFKPVRPRSRKRQIDLAPPVMIPRTCHRDVRQRFREWKASIPGYLPRKRRWKVKPKECDIMAQCDTGAQEEVERKGEQAAETADVAIFDHLRTEGSAPTAE